jgi:hypothetical protein
LTKALQYDKIVYIGIPQVINNQHKYKIDNTSKNKRFNYDKKRCFNMKKFKRLKLEEKEVLSEYDFIM